MSKHQSKVEKLITELCPDGVVYRSIGECAECYAGATPRTGVAKYWEKGTVPWMSSGEVNKGVINETEVKISKAGFESCSTKMVPANSVVVALAGQGKTRGMVAVTRIPLCTNQSLCSIIPNNSLNSDFLYHFLKSQYQQLRKVSSGDGTRGGLNLKMIKSYKIPVPPLAVQEEIVRILNTFTELETELEAKLETELQARKMQYDYYLAELLAPKSEAGSWVPLGDIGTLIRGSGMPKTDFKESGVGCIHYGQIYTHYGTSASSTKSFVSSETAKILKKVNKGDLIVASTSENIADVCKAVAWLGDEEIVTGGHATILKHKQNPKYLSYYFKSPSFFDQKIKFAKGTKVIDVSAKDLAKIKIFLPSLSEQERFVSILDKLDTHVNDLSISLSAELAARRSHYEYYRGKLLTFKKYVG